MRYVSVFSGIEAASVAWGPLGWEPVAFCEIDEFPSAVLRARYPDVPNLGDITKVDWSAFKEKHGAVDVVVGGSPCQSFSIAGKREGLAGASGLMFEYIRCVQGLMPRWFIWENVPGALSSERGGAFAQLLMELDGLGYGLAWRILDAQFFGVAQRRRRVFLVGHFGDMRACEVLLEPEGMRWDYPTSRGKREELARSARRGPASGLGGVLAFAQNTRDEVRYQNGDGSLVGALCAEPGAKQQTYVMRMAQTSANGIGIDSELTHTIDTTGPEAAAYALKVRCGSDTYVKWDGSIGTAGKGALVGDECAFTIAATQDQTVMAMSSGQANAEISQDGTCPTITCLHEQPIVFDRAAISQGPNARFKPLIERADTSPTIVTDGAGGGSRTH